LTGSNTSTPHSFTHSTLTNLSYIGDICPKGYYCPQGSIIPTACPAGSYNTQMGAVSISDCTSCSPGYYCEGTGNIFPTGQCLDGYYCTGGSSTSTQFMSEPGYFSIAGASNQSACSPGSYNMDNRQSFCLSCPKGFYCPVSGMSTYEAYLCNTGHYCPSGTINPLKCPSGTFSNATGNVNVTECTSCTAGYYCQFDGLTSETAPCDAGYYCLGGATSKIQPATSSTGGQCFRGHYCLNGTSYPTPCPRGTYMATKLNEGQHYFEGVNYFCNRCPAGKACDGEGLQNSTSNISGGYWASGGAPSATPICSSSLCLSSYGICPTGYYCPTNSTAPLICPPGHYQDNVGQSSCKVFNFLIYIFTI
jgi:hypothetical protein